MSKRKFTGRLSCYSNQKNQDNNAVNNLCLPKKPHTNKQAYLSCETPRFHEQKNIGAGRREKCPLHITDAFTVDTASPVIPSLLLKYHQSKDTGCSSQPGHGQSGRTVSPRLARNRYLSIREPFWGEGKGNQLIHPLLGYLQLATEIRHSCSKFTSKSIRMFLFEWVLDAHSFTKPEVRKGGPCEAATAGGQP